MRFQFRLAVTVPTWLTFIVVSTALATLSGCAVTPEQRARLEPQAVKFVPKQGVAMVKVASNRNIGTFFGKWQTLRIQNTETEETFDLSDRSPPHALHSFYVGSVPAGTYQLVKFDSQAHGAISIISTAAIGPRAGRFKVAEGSVTDLGTILYLRPHYPLGTRLYRLAFASGQIESDSALKSLDPVVSESAKRAVNGWSPLSGEESRPALEKAAAANLSLFLNNPHPTPEGTMLFGEALGLIAQRDKGGNWTWMDTGTVNTILALHVARDGSIVAGSEQSLLLAKPPQGNAWRTIPFPLVDATIRFVGEHPQLGHVVVAQDRRNIVVLTCNDLLNPVWSEIRRIPVELFANPMMDTQFEAFMAGDKLFVVTKSPQFTLKIAIHALDVKTKSWSEVPIDLYGLAYSAMDDGSIYAMAGPNISQHLYVSRNAGATWEKRTSPNWMHQPVFRGTKEGYGIRIEDIPLFDAEKLTNSLWKTADGGVTWSKIASVPNQSAKLILLPEAGQMLLATSNGGLYRSTDDGLSWNLERKI